MVRNYKRKRSEQITGTEKLSSALEAVCAGMPVAEASRHFGVPERTLARHRVGAVAKPGQTNPGRHRTVLTLEVDDCSCVICDEPF